MIDNILDIFHYELEMINKLAKELDADDHELWLCWCNQRNIINKDKWREEN